MANYALGTLGKEPTHTTGIIELGGASAQVLFCLLIWLLLVFFAANHITVGNNNINVLWEYFLPF